MLNMDLDFQAVLNKRKFESLGVIKGVKIIDGSLLNNLLEEILDQLYIERLLEDGTCTVCQIKTSKCCSNCGTHYCSTTCQRSDWLNHKMTCLRSQLQSTGDSLCRKPSQLESTSTSAVCDDSNSNSKRGNYKETDKKLEDSSRYSSFQDVSHVEVRNTPDNESDTDTSREKSKRMQSKNNRKKYFKFKQKKMSKEAEGDSKSKDSNPEEKENTMKFERKTVRKMFAPGQKLTVKRMSPYKENYWVLEKRDAKKFEEIQERLECEWKTYAKASYVTNDLFGLKFNQKWYRCRMICQGVKNLVQCVDTGQIFCPKHIGALELPADLKVDNGLAFKVFFVDSFLPEEDGEWLNVQVVKLLPKCVYSVKLCEKKKTEFEKKDAARVEGEGKKNKDREEEKGEERMEEALAEKEGTEPRKSVFDELKPTAKGTFLPGKIGKAELLGCLAPEDVNEVMCCYNKITGLYIADGNKTDANVGEDVMVAGDDSIGHRGIVKSKSLDMYNVQLVDYGYTIQTNEVYKMPEKTADMIQLACRVTLLDDPPRRYDEFEVKRAYEFEVMEQKKKDVWLCKFAIYPDLNKVFACGIVEMPWKRRARKVNYVPFANGSEVVLTGVGTINDVHIKHANGEWDEFLEKLNLELNQYVMDTVSDLDVDDVRPGDIILCQYKQDELWYRAKVIHKKKNSVNVVFVDYGNFQISTPSELRRMPDGVDEPFFSRKVNLGGSTDCFSPEGREYLLNVKKENLPLILSFKGKDISDDVTLFDKSGTNINEIAFGKEEPPRKDICSDAGFDTAKFLKSEGFNVGVAENFICLYMDKNSFRKHGVFWAVNPESSNFKCVIELDGKLSKHCESDSGNVSVESGMLCIAKYQGNWYRGLVMDIFGPLIDVFFVDFGNSQILARDCIRKMVPEFFQISATAVKCFVNGFDELDAREIQRVEAFISENLNKPLKNIAVVVKVVDESHYVEFRTK